MTDVRRPDAFDYASLAESPTTMTGPWLEEPSSLADPLADPLTEPEAPLTLKDAATVLAAPAKVVGSTPSKSLAPLAGDSSSTTLAAADAVVAGAGAAASGVKAVHALQDGDGAGALKHGAAATSKGVVATARTSEALGGTPLPKEAQAALGLMNVPANAATVLDTEADTADRTTAGLRVVADTGKAADGYAKAQQVASGASSASGLPGVAKLAGAAGGTATAVSGLSTALDETKDTNDRVVGGVEAVGGTLSATGSAVGGTVAYTEGLGAIAAGGGGTLAASAGAVVGAGVAGYKVGDLMHDASTSDHARAPIYGQDEAGQDRTSTDLLIDHAVDANLAIQDLTGSELLGAAAGGAILMSGSFAAATEGTARAGYNYLFGDD